jgi:hypothetical protein
MKRVMSVMLPAVALALVLSSPVVAVELKDSTKCPPNFARLLEKEGKKEIVFGTGITAYDPTALNQVLACYGLALKDPSKVPSSFATVVEKEGKKEIVFGPAVTARDPTALNQILAGYE